MQGLAKQKVRPAGKGVFQLTRKEVNDVVEKGCPRHGEMGVEIGWPARSVKGVKKGRVEE